MLKICLTFLVFAITLSGFSQNDIKNLKNGVVLVKLYTNANKIAALEKQGLNKRAEDEKKKVELEHLEIINAFKKEFKFTNYYFFYSNNMNEIKKGDYANVIDSLKQGAHIDKPDSMVYILDSRSYYSESMASSYLGFSMLNNKGEQLEKPFPYYVRKREALWFLRRSYFDLTRIMNKQLEEYLKD